MDHDPFDGDDTLKAFDLRVRELRHWKTDSLKSLECKQDKRLTLYRDFLRYVRDRRKTNVASKFVDDVTRLANLIEDEPIPHVRGNYLCPRCEEELWRDEVDIGVGMVYGPWGCHGCGWSESPQYDCTDGPEKAPATSETHVADPSGGLTPRHLCPECGGNLGGCSVGRIEDHKSDCSRLPF